MSQQIRYIRWFNELTITDIPLVGGKNASLGEMYRELLPQGIDVGQEMMRFITALHC